MHAVLQIRQFADSYINHIKYLCLVQVANQFLASYHWFSLTKCACAGDTILNTILQDTIQSATRNILGYSTIVEVQQNLEHGMNAHLV